MTEVVVDASAFGPLFFADEAGALFDALPELIAEGRCVVPQHWRLEVTNQILSGLRRKRTTGALAEQAMAQVGKFPLRIDDRTADRFAESYVLASRHGLTIYDAAYLELALRLGATVVSYDSDLRRAAHAEGVNLLPE
ncbi:MAG: type II toxin-antitoxin system VapC family toxin [Novosphingobium sp.]